MLEQFLSTFFAIGFAELGDKTQFAVLALAAKYSKKTPIILGAILAFMIADAIGVAIGSVFSLSIPASTLKLAAGVLFILVGVYTLFSKEEPESKNTSSDHNVFIASFTLVFLMEMGDKTQLANALFAAIYPPFIVWIASTLAMSVLTLAAVAIGKKMFDCIDGKTVKIVSGLLFVLVGIAVLFL